MAPFHHEETKGDSGGGVFITTKTGTYLAGVNSFGAAWDGNVNSDYGDVCGYTRVSAFTSWINSIIGGSVLSTLGSATTGSTSLRAMDSFTPIPEPSAICLLAMAGLALAVWRRLR